jgi:hypothetical protein
MNKNKIYLLKMSNYTLVVSIVILLIGEILISSSGSLSKI